MRLIDRAIIGEALAALATARVTGPYDSVLSRDVLPTSLSTS